MTLVSRNTYRPWFVLQNGNDGSLVRLNVLVAGSCPFQSHARHGGTDAGDAAD